MRVRECGPTVGSHELRPALVEASWVELAEAGLARPGSQVVVEALVPHAHLVVERIALGHDALAGARTLLPILHVVLLKSSRGAEGVDASQAIGLLHVWSGC